MNDRVSEELLAEAAGRHAARISGVTTVVTAEYKGQGYSFRDDGWFNATEAAQRYGKEPAQWQRLPATIEYVEAFKRRYGEITHVETSRARADRGPSCQARCKGRSERRMRLRGLRLFRS